MIDLLNDFLINLTLGCCVFGVTKGDLASYGSPGSTGDHDHDHQQMDEYIGGQTDSGTDDGDYSITMKTTFRFKF